MIFTERQLRECIMNVLLEENIFTKKEDIPEILLNTNLQDVGMNSIQFIELIVLLERTFSIEIKDEDLVMEKFFTLNQIVQTLKKYEKGEEKDET